MALTADTRPAAPPPAAAYVIHPGAHATVRALLQHAGLAVRLDAAVGPTQIPRYLVAAPHAFRRDGEDRTLSDREMQVLQLVAHGHSNPAIARQLFLGDNTIKTHMRNLMRKLDARGRAHAVHIAHQRGILGDHA
jgi:DNA-binding NarL/FixJ family response regulator